MPIIYGGKMSAFFVGVTFSNFSYLNTRQMSNLLQHLQFQTSSLTSSLQDPQFSLDDQICISKQSTKNYRRATANNEYSSSLRSVLLHRLKKIWLFSQKTECFLGKKKNVHNNIKTQNYCCVVESYPKSVRLMDGFLISRHVFTSVGAKCSYQLQLNY